MARDDWRIRIELPDEGGARGLLARLGLGHGRAETLADELENRRLAVTHDGDTVFVYAESGLQAERARQLVEEELAEERVTPRRLVLEHWLSDEERWDDEAAPKPTDQDLLDRGYAPWEVRVECKSVREARELAERLERDGYGVTRTFTYVVAGTASREEAVELARRVHGQVEPGGELVYEVLPQNPFAVFGGLTGTGTGTPL